eukprot:scaffold1778_cov246-Pinguiococcus_pyrenoidosus.AAC.19
MTEAFGQKCPTRESPDDTRSAPKSRPTPGGRAVSPSNRAARGSERSLSRSDEAVSRTYLALFIGHSYSSNGTLLRLLASTLAKFLRHRSSAHGWAMAQLKYLTGNGIRSQPTRVPTDARRCVTMPQSCAFGGCYGTAALHRSFLDGARLEMWIFQDWRTEARSAVAPRNCIGERLS